MRANGVGPTAEGTKIYPGAIGATNWYSPSFSPRTGLFYIPAWDQVYGNFTKTDTEFNEGKRFVGGGSAMPVPPLRGPQIRKPSEMVGYGAVRAIDPKTGERKWEFKSNAVTTSGILTTASDLLFPGGREGFFQALDARSGNLLWTGAAAAEVPIRPLSHQVTGQQYLAFAARTALSL